MRRHGVTLKAICLGLSSCAAPENMQAVNTDNDDREVSDLSQNRNVQIEAADFAELTKRDPKAAEKTVSGSHNIVIRGKVKGVDTDAHTISVSVGHGSDIVELFPRPSDAEEQQAASRSKIGKVIAVSCVQVLADKYSAQASDCTGFDR